MFSSPTLRLLGAACACALLTSCAVSKPNSTVEPSALPTAAFSATPEPTPSDTPFGTPSASPSVAPVDKPREGVTFKIPEGYENATGLITDNTNSTVAYLRDAAGNGIHVRTAGTDYPDMKSFLEFYVKAQNAGEETVTNQRTLQIAGLDGAEVTFKSKLDGRISTLFVTIKGTNLYMVSGVTPDGPTRQAVEKVAMSLVIP